MLKKTRGGIIEKNQEVVVAIKKIQYSIKIMSKNSQQQTVNDNLLLSRKELQIAFMNAMNTTSQVMARMAPILLNGTKSGYTKYEKMLDTIHSIHMNRYSGFRENLIANLSVPYNQEDAMIRLKSAKNYQELEKAWFSLSGDERHDDEIIKVKNDLKKIYEENSNGATNSTVGTGKKG